MGGNPKCLTMKIMMMMMTMAEMATKNIKF